MYAVIETSAQSGPDGDPDALWSVRCLCGNHIDILAFATWEDALEASAARLVVAEDRYGRPPIETTVAYSGRYGFRRWQWVTEDDEVLHEVIIQSVLIASPSALNRIPGVS